MSMWIIWLIAAGVFFVAEIITVGFLIFWLGIGALLAMIASFFTENIIIQASIFLISSGILIFLTKPFVDKYVTKKTIPTNMYSLIGKRGIVTVDIDPIKSAGQVKVNGESWSAKTDDETLISAGTEIEVLKIDGVKAIVQKVNQSSILN